MLSFNDKTANGNNLTNHGATEYTSDFPYAAITEAVALAAASNQYLDAVDSASLSITGDISLGVWVKMTSQPSNVRWGLISKFTSAGGQGSYIFEYADVAGVKRLTFWPSDDGTNVDELLVTQSLSTGIWTHVGLTWTAATKTARFYINGVQSGSNQVGARSSLFNATSALIVGQRSTELTAGQYLDAKVADVRIYNNIHDFSTDYNTLLVGNESGLVAWYPLTDFSSPSSSLSPSASISPSSSVSSSLSPSASRSPSASSSPSLSPSASLSASRSPSASVSNSQSPSASNSPSASTSPSASSSSSTSSSISSSISSSPSQGYSLFTRDAQSVLPVNTDDLHTMYTDEEEEAVSTENGIRIDQEGALAYMIHQFKVFLGDQTFCEIECELKSDLAPSMSAVYLQIYNQLTDLWETVDANGSHSANIDFEMEAKIPDTTNYKDAGKVISCRVYQLAI